MKETDPYFMLMRGLLRHLASKGIIGRHDATTVVSQALNTAADSGDMESAMALEELERLMVDSAPPDPPGPANDPGSADGGP